MIKFIMKIYAGIRRSKNPLVLPVADSWYTDYSKFTMAKFSKFLNSFKYKADKIGGLIDRNETFEHFIDDTVTSDRDCDDWARMWSLWGIYNGYRAHEFILLNKRHPFKTAHVITVLEKNGKFYLCNYRNYPVTYSLEEAVNIMKEIDLDYSKNMLYVENDTFEPLNLG